MKEEIKKLIYSVFTETKVKEITCTCDTCENYKYELINRDLLIEKLDELFTKS